MNATHPFWFIALPETSAKLVLTPCPGTKESSLPEALSVLKDQGVSAILTLMTTEEMEKNQVADLEAETNKSGMKWFHLPIADDQGPTEVYAAAWSAAGPEVHQLLNQGQSVAIHCKGGSGRTGLVAAQIMLERGMELDHSIKLIKEQRPGAFSSPQQQEYIQQVAERIQ
ncbi:cyclin-dependent kinase inhibitor 3 family protein [Endozoicomonas arenosclerae]|uniref:cyclin-dependent kinase inhibitor 3 family protein n=1 Tax=Endozoicomonas arenosclerae TaxID=1633495 RepID=UPI000785B0ED|nr:cyclin-dependent kinase inhibitor 3 family protein [Endozoicomonas arenosclerae]